MRWMLLLVMSAGLVVGCGDDDDDDGGGAIDAAAGAVDAAATPDATPTIDATPQVGKITVTASGITGANGKVVLAFIRGQGGGPLGNVCEPVSGDPASISGVVKMQVADPCTLGAEVTFDPGTYEVEGGIFTPGEMMPDLCANTTVTVDGDTTTTLPAFGACE